MESDIKKAESITLVDTILKFLFYYCHERVWYKYIKYGISIDDNNDEDKNKEKNIEP